MTVTVTSEDGRTLDYFDVEIEAARISLSVDEGDIIEKSNNKADTPGDMIIPVTNSGMLGTDSVQVILVVEATGEEYNTTISVGPQSTADAIFSLPALDAATPRFQVRVDVLGEDADYVEDEVEDFDFQVKFQISDETPEESGWFTALVAGFLILIAFFGLRFIFSSRSSKF